MNNEEKVRLQAMALGKPLSETERLQATALGNRKMNNILRENVLCDWGLEPEDLEPYNVLFEFYEVSAYDGEAIVILQHKESKKLYITEGSHCSCYGLEGQFEPDLTTKAYLENRILNGSFSSIDEADSQIKTELKKILETYKE